MLQLDKDQELLRNLARQLGQQGDSMDLKATSSTSIMRGSFVRVLCSNSAWQYYCGTRTLEPGDLLYVNEVRHKCVRYQTKSRGQESVSLQFVQQLPGIYGLRVCMRDIVYARASERFSGDGEIVNVIRNDCDGDLRVRVKVGLKYVNVPLNAITLTVPTLSHDSICDQVKEAKAKRERERQQRQQQQQLASDAKCAAEVTAKERKRIQEEQHAKEWRNIARRHLVVNKLQRHGLISYERLACIDYDYLLRRVKRNWGAAFFAFAWLVDRVLPTYQRLACLSSPTYRPQTLIVYGPSAAAELADAIDKIKNHLGKGISEITITQHDMPKFQIGK